MEQLTDLPNIGNIIAEKLICIGIKNKHDLVEVVSKNAIIKLATLENNGVCINLLFAMKEPFRD